jgi:hypothetical protein
MRRGLACRTQNPTEGFCVGMFGWVWDFAWCLGFCVVFGARRAMPLRILGGVIRGRSLIINAAGIAGLGIDFIKE